MPSLIKRVDSESSLFALDEETKYSSFDEMLNNALENNGEMFSIASLVRGRKTEKPEPKRQKKVDMKPITFVRFNTQRGKPKLVTIKALLDS